MECGEQCVTMAGITMMPELCADNWGTVSTQEEVCCQFIQMGDVANSQMLPQSGKLATWSFDLLLFEW